MTKQFSMLEPPEPHPAHFGSPAKSLVRYRDPSTSVEAACSIDSAGLEKMVYDIIKSYGDQGCISDDIARRFPAGYGIQTISPRYAKLKKKGLIEETGEKRPGLCGRKQLVLRAVEK